MENKNSFSHSNLALREAYASRSVVIKHSFKQMIYIAFLFTLFLMAARQCGMLKICNNVAIASLSRLHFASAKCNRST